MDSLVSIFHKIQLDNGCPSDRVTYRLLASLPHFTNFDHELGLYIFGDSKLPACSVSTEPSGFRFYDHLSDREISREVFNALIVAIESKGLGKPDVSET